MPGRRQDLRTAYDALRQRHFPEGSDDETASQLHAELVLIDTELNGLIARSLGGAEPGLFGPEDEWRYLDLKARLESLIRDGDVRAATDARRYLDHLRGLWEVVVLAKLQ
jgi:hypothetical protein